MSTDKYPLQNLLFSYFVDDDHDVPDHPGIYFIYGENKIYIGCGEHLNIRIPQSIRERKFGFTYHYVMIPEFRFSSLKEIEAVHIITMNTIMFVNRITGKYDIELANRTHLYGLPMAAWNPLYAHIYKYPIAVVQTVLRTIGVSSKDVVLKPYEECLKKR